MQEVDFPALLDKTLHADLRFYAYCPSQDIIACCFSDHISCHRLNWQRLWVFQQQQGDSPPTALVWHPEARFLGVGFESGLVILLNPENGELCGKSQAATSPVNSMHWVEEEEGTSAEPAIWNALLRRTHGGAAQGAHISAPQLPSKLAVLCITDGVGNITLLTAGLSTLATFEFALLLGQEMQPGKGEHVHVLKASASRDLRFVYVIWEALSPSGKSSGRHLTVLDVSVVGQAKTELRIITGLMEQVATDFEGVADTVQQVEAKWKTVVEAIGSVRAGLVGLLRDMGLEHNRDEDLKQLERLLILGETACAENVMHQYLTSTLGEGSLKRTAKAVDAALGQIASSDLTELQAHIRSLVALTGSLHSLLLCKGYFQPLGLQSTDLRTARECACCLLEASGSIALWATNQQVKWRKFFAWLLQTTRFMTSSGQSQPHMPVNTDSILEILASLRSKALQKSIFGPQMTDATTGKESIFTFPGWEREEVTDLGFEAQLRKFRQLCYECMSRIPLQLSDNIKAVQHIELPPAASHHPSTALSLSQGSKDGTSRHVTFCTVLGSAAAELQVVRLMPPKQQPCMAGTHVVEHALLKLSPDAFVDMAAFQILDSCWLALLLRQNSDGLLKFVPTQALHFKTLPAPNSSLQQVVQASPSNSLTGAESVRGCSLGDGSFQGPLVVSGSRRMACVLNTSRRLGIYDLEELTEELNDA